MRIESAAFSIRDVIHFVQVLFIGEINEKGLSFSALVDDTVPVTLSGDATRLTQILVNITGNAVKFTPTGTISIRVNNMGATGDITRLEFVISDTGIGIANEKLPGIFERFRQAEDSITRKYGGSGLGLSIVKDLVQLQNGEIEVESELGMGTIFRFIIPYKITERKIGNHALPGDMAPGNAGFQNINILVVDDNTMNQNLLGHLLSEWKFSFEQVYNGIEALEKLKRGRYDLVLMDIQMPGMDGYTATQEIRGSLKLDIPIIAMTAHAFQGEREKCLGYGMNEYIAKPVNDKELYGLLKQFTGVAADEGKPSKDVPHKSPLAYKVINLLYMQDVSNGNKKYERTVTEQFIEAIPLDLETLQFAFTNRDENLLKQTAHNMRTNVSVMGLLEKLQLYLDELEYEPFEEARFQQAISSVKTTCMDALPEAHHFYTTLQADQRNL